MQVGVIGGSGFYKLEELEDTKQITVFNSFILQTDPWEWGFCSFAFQNFLLDGGPIITPHY